MNGRAYGEQRVFISISGTIAERRCQQGSAPGWRRSRSRDELVAFHEAGHAIVAAVLGYSCSELTIIPDPRRGFEGLCNVVPQGAADAPASEPAAPLPIVSDRQRSSVFSRLLAQNGVGWRETLAEYRRLRKIAVALIEANWPIITALAEILVERKQLSQAEFETLISRYRPVESSRAMETA